MENQDKLGLIDWIVCIVALLFIGFPLAFIGGVLSVRWTIFLLEQVTK